MSRDAVFDDDRPDRPPGVGGSGAQDGLEEFQYSLGVGVPHHRASVLDSDVHRGRANLHEEREIGHRGTRCQDPLFGADTW